MINIQAIQKPRREDAGLSLSVHSIFATIQGEGIFAGHPAIFIRLAGCNLQCPLCDTEYTKDAVELTIDFISDQVRGMILFDRINNPLVVITGGEPFRQNITPLVDALSNFAIVQIETNGTLPPSSDFPKYAKVVCSPKTGKVHPKLFCFITAYKYVVNFNQLSEKDGLPLTALDHSASPQLARPHKDFNGPIYLQPCDMQVEQLNKLNLDAVIKSCLKFGYILQLQIHKIIGVA